MIPVYIGLMILDGLLLWALVGAKGWWSVKIVAIVVVILFNISVWRSRGSFEGWPMSKLPPEQSVLVACQVDEPSAIYLWLVPYGRDSVIDPFGYKPKIGEPRSFRVPYSRDLHEACESAKKAQRQGREIGLRRIKGAARSNGRKIPKWAFRAYVLPPPSPGPKDQVPYNP